MLRGAGRDDEETRTLRTRVLELEAQVARDHARNQRGSQDSEKMLTELLTARKNVDILTGNVETLKALSVQLATQLEEANQSIALMKEQDTIAAMKRDRDVAAEMSAVRIEYEGRLMDLTRELEESTRMCTELRDSVKDASERREVDLAKLRDEKDALIRDLLERNESLHTTIAAFTSKVYEETKGGVRGANSARAFKNDTIPRVPGVLPAHYAKGSLGGAEVRRTRQTAWSSTAESDTESDERSVLALNIHLMNKSTSSTAHAGRSPAALKINAMGLAASSAIAQHVTGHHDSARFHVDVAADPAVFTRVTSGESRSGSGTGSATPKTGFQSPSISVASQHHQLDERQQWSFTTPSGTVVTLACNIRRGAAALAAETSVTELR